MIKTKKLYGLLKDIKLGDSYLLAGYNSDTAIQSEVAKWNKNNKRNFNNQIKIMQKQFFLVDFKKIQIGKVWYITRIE